ncbi:D-erythronate dehydrogenase, partial [Salinisphaera sp.]|uniref:D-erythronate dehydrogenase n=1 Tax=Salinisphaera sp. TaxID=1914330 RepID=UPI002D78B1AE
MRILVTGGAGFLGARLIQSLLDTQPLIDGQRARAITSLDVGPCPISDERVESVTGDISDPRVIESALGPDVAVVCHLAAVVSAEAEADFQRGMQVNFDATRVLLDACRRLAQAPRFLFASSLAVFGPGEVEPLAEDTAPMPQSSYGTQKAIGELLVNDYSRRGFIDGRACRLPTIVVRPGRPNKAASSFASSIIREPLNGEDAICPVASDLPLWLSSPRTAVTNLVHALTLPADRLGDWRTFNLPGLTVTVSEMLDALERQAGIETRARVRFEPDAAIESIVNSWPGGLETKRSLALGFV